MLVDIRFKPFTQEVIDRVIQYCGEPPKHPPRLDRGLYVGLNFPVREVEEHLVEDVPAYRDSMGSGFNMADYMDGERKHLRAMRKLYTQKYQRNYRALDSYGAYGLCDTPEQLLEYFPHIVDDNIPRICTFAGFKREDQSDSGGFRYHKWGQYIGKQKPKHEYLHDDLHIDMVVSFHIYRVEDLICG